MYRDQRHSAHNRGHASRNCHFSSRKYLPSGTLSGVGDDVIVTVGVGVSVLVGVVVGVAAVVGVGRAVGGNGMCLFDLQQRQGQKQIDTPRLAEDRVFALRTRIRQS